jgi:hypothetical protein
MSQVLSCPNTTYTTSKVNGLNKVKYEIVTDCDTISKAITSAKLCIQQQEVLRSIYLKYKVNALSTPGMSENNIKTQDEIAKKMDAVDSHIMEQHKFIANCTDLINFIITAN